MKNKRKYRTIVPEEIDKFRIERELNDYFSTLLKDIDENDVSTNYEICPEEPLSLN